MPARRFKRNSIKQGKFRISYASLSRITPSQLLLSSLVSATSLVKLPENPNVPADLATTSSVFDEIAWLVVCIYAAKATVHTKAHELSLKLWSYPVFC